ncbi:MAG: hypothetical protein KF681_07230 [Bdellovibrionaceae bacterium]|nr:hypothetical protein [Pseudobdellovibrionaceae bacterium]
MVAQVTASAKEAIKGRFGDPVVGTYSFTFLVWNYEVLFFAASDLPVRERISEISRIVSSAQSFLVPAAIVVGIFSMPHFLPFLYRFIENGRVKKNNVRVHAERDLISHRQEVEFLEKRFQTEVNKVDALNRVISDKDQEIGSLRKTVFDIEKETGKDLSEDLVFARGNAVPSEIRAGVSQILKTGLRDLLITIVGKSLASTALISEYDELGVGKLIGLGYLERQGRTVAPTESGLDLFKFFVSMDTEGSSEQF